MPRERRLALEPAFESDSEGDGPEQIEGSTRASGTSIGGVGLAKLVHAQILLLEAVPWISLILWRCFDRRSGSNDPGHIRLADGSTDSNFEQFLTFCSPTMCSFACCNFVALLASPRSHTDENRQQWRVAICDFAFTVMKCCIAQTFSAFALWSLLLLCRAYLIHPKRLRDFDDVARCFRARSDVREGHGVFEVDFVPMRADLETLRTFTILENFIWLATKVLWLSLQYVFLSWVYCGRDNFVRKALSSLVEGRDEIFYLIVEQQSAEDEANDVHHPGPIDLPHGLQEGVELHVPSEFTCPISKSLCLQPTVASSGITYDLPNILLWLESHSTDPITREFISERVLFPNYALRSAIYAWARQVTARSQRRAAEIGLPTGPCTRGKTRGLAC